MAMIQPPSQSGMINTGMVAVLGGSKAVPWLSFPLSVDAANNLGLVPTFARTTGATCVDYLGNVIMCDANEARFEGGRRISAGVWSNVKPDGTPIVPAPMLLMEGQNQNICLQSAAFGTTWTQTNMGITPDTTASPEGTTTADTLTAQADNATLVQSFTAASAAYTLSLYVKRKTGTGAVSLSLDGGSTYTAVTVTSVWTRVSITQTILNPSVVIKLATNTDAIYVWGAQVEASPVPTSYIPTTTAAVTRTADTLSWPLHASLQAMLSIDKAWTTSLANQTGAGSSACNYTDATALFKFSTFNAAPFANAGNMVITRDSSNRLAWGYLGAAQDTTGCIVYKDSARTVRGYTKEASFSGTPTTFDVVGDCVAEGTVVLDWVPGYSGSDVNFTNTQKFVLSTNGAGSLLYRAEGTDRADVLVTYDTTSSCTMIFDTEKNIRHRIVVRYSSVNRSFSTSLIKNDNLITSSIVAFDGAYTLGTLLELHKSNTWPCKYSNLRFFRRVLTDAELLRL